MYKNPEVEDISLQPSLAQAWFAENRFSLNFINFSFDIPITQAASHFEDLKPVSYKIANLEKGIEDQE